MVGVEVAVIVVAVLPRVAIAARAAVVTAVRAVLALAVLPAAVIVLVRVFEVVIAVGNYLYLHNH